MQHSRKLSILAALSELDTRLVPETVQRRFKESLRQLEQIASDASSSSLSEQRIEEITQRERAELQQDDPEVNNMRDRIRRDRKTAELNRELALMQASWDEAFGRLPPDSKMVAVTSERSSAADLQQYLMTHRAELAPEEIFFAQASIELRKVKDRLRAVTGDLA